MRLCRLLVVIAVVSMFVARTDLRADVTPPSNPTLTPTTGSGFTSPATEASVEAWDLIEESILAMYPGATYGEICYYALMWYNVYPPNYCEIPPSLPAPPPSPPTLP
jgi:hypothetical protein